MANVRLGIIGPGKITTRFLKGCGLSSGIEVVAAASRDFDKAVKFCAEHGIEHAFGNYEEMCASGLIDAVYIATPPFTHYELVKMCLNHNVHVLCEKPFLTDSKQIEEVFELARSKGKLLMEAMKAVYTPTTLQVKKWLADKVIGELVYAEASDSYKSPYEHDHWVFYKGRMGGGILDVGVYPIAYLLYLIDSPIVSSTGMKVLGETGVDEVMQILINFENGVMGSVRAGLKVNMQNKAIFYGTKGYIEVSDFWKCTEAKLKLEGQEEISWKSDFESDFQFEIQHFIDCIKKGALESPVMSKQFSMKMIDLINSNL